MENLTELQGASYGTFKQALGTELKTHAEGFVRIGYLLKLARDTNVIQEGGYNNVNDFAQKEFSLTKDMVSRYIRINDRYSVDGYSDRLEDSYSQFGYAKLADMLTLPDNMIEVIPPEATRREIQKIVNDVREEEKITDLEVMMESPDLQKQELKNTLEKVLHQIFYEDKWRFANLVNELSGIPEDQQMEKVRDVLTPAGYLMKTVRIPQIGRLMLTIRGEHEPIDIVDTRHPENTENYTWPDLLAAIHQFVISGKKGEGIWETIYGEPFKEISESCTGATAQKPEKTESEQKKAPKPEPKPKAEPKQEKTQEPEEPQTIEKTECEEVQEELESAVKYPLSEGLRLLYEDRAEAGNFIAKCVIKADDEYHANEEGQGEGTDEQLPGQMDVSDYPELTPDTQVQQDPEVLTGSVENTESGKDTVENWLRIETQALLREVSENNWMSAISISQLITEFLQKTMKDRIEGVTNE